MTPAARRSRWLPAWFAVGFAIASLVTCARCTRAASDEARFISECRALLAARNAR